MSIDLNWETLTTGPDGEALAHGIRDFIHAKFQAVPLPRFIKSVTVHDFQFGAVAPELELKDITDPLPDFYEEDPAADDEDGEDDSGDDDDEAAASFEAGDVHMPDALRAASERRRRAEARLPGGAHLPASIPHDLGSPFLGVSTPGIPGGTSNLNYFHSHPLGLSGTQTPLAAVAGAQLGNSSWLEAGSTDNGRGGSSPSMSTMVGNAASPFGAEGGIHPPSHSRNPSQSSISVSGDFGPSAAGGIAGLSALTPTYPAQGQGLPIPSLREKSSVSTLAPTSVCTSRPPTRDATAALAGSAIAEDEEGDGLGDDGHGEDGKPHRRFREPRVEDIQTVFRIKYAGDVKLMLTAEILLDYPMPSFVGIPVRLNITGLTFDGVGVVAYIRKRVHFCFLGPEDALAAVGPDEEGQGHGGVDEHGRGSGKLGGLLQEIKVESEIGQREGGKQSLKNVGKVERFVLEQVRRIFEDEFVYPSFWTFLV